MRARESARELYQEVDALASLLSSSSADAPSGVHLLVAFTLTLGPQRPSHLTTKKEVDESQSNDCTTNNTLLLKISCSVALTRSQPFCRTTHARRNYGLTHTTQLQPLSWGAMKGGHHNLISTSPATSGKLVACLLIIFNAWD